MDDQVTLPAYTDEIRELIKQDHNDEAIAHCKHILAHYPKYIDAYRQMGEAYLEKGDLDSAKDLFRRVLSADPENIVAYTGLSIIFERQQLINEAIWHLERAYELAPGNADLQKELLRLYNEADIKAHARLKLTPGALARIYAQEGLYAHALQEFRGIIATVPSRYDIRVALAETLWRMGRLSEATQVAQSILEQLPYCIKANLILGTAWKQVGLPESEHYLHRVQLLDPTNQAAIRLMGSDSPLTPLKAFVPRYVETKSGPAPSITAMPDIFTTSETEAQIASTATSTEFPSEQLATEMPSVTEASPASAAELSVKPDVEPTNLPPWLQTPFPETKEAEQTTAEQPSWLMQLRQGVEAAAEENVESAELTAEQAAETTQPVVEDKLTTEVESTQELPSWLEVSPTIESEKPTEPATPSWLPKETTAEQAQVKEESLPSWLQELTKSEPTKDADQTTLPSWMAEKPAKPEETPSESITPESAQENLPDWMADTSATKPIEPEKSAVSWIPKEKPAEPEKFPQEDLPAWMADTSATKPVETEKPTPSWIPKEAPTEPEKSAEENLPAWMAEKPAKPEPVTPATIEETAQEPEKTPEQVLPEWIAEKPVAPVAEEPVIKEQPSVEPVQAVELPSTAPLPAWLENLKQSTEPIEETRTEEIAPATPVEAAPITPKPAAQPSPTPVPEPVAAEPAIVETPRAQKAAPKGKRQPKGYTNLTTAREHRAANRLDEAMKEYDYIVQRAPRLANQVIDDLEALIQQRLDAPLEAHRILGDAYARADRLHEALEQYRFVLEHTPK
ncbi:MAG: tetratricopeptide repeat protein [Chloroflexi bacterium]|nr:tetratricopeptide repeat protein [Chloroflexota bacterium]